MPSPGRLELVYKPADGGEPVVFEVHEFKDCGGVAMGMYNTDEVRFQIIYMVESLFIHLFIHFFIHLLFRSFHPSFFHSCLHSFLPFFLPFLLSFYAFLVHTYFLSSCPHYIHSLPSSLIVNQRLCSQFIPVCIGQEISIIHEVNCYFCVF